MTWLDWVGIGWGSVVLLGMLALALYESDVDLKTLRGWAEALGLLVLMALGFSVWAFVFS